MAKKCSVALFQVDKMATYVQKKYYFMTFRNMVRITSHHCMTDMAVRLVLLVEHWLFIPSSIPSVNKCNGYGYQVGHGGLSPGSRYIYGFTPSIGTTHFLLETKHADSVTAQAVCSVWIIISSTLCMCIHQNTF